MKQFLCIACALGCMVFLSCVKKDSNPTAVPSVFISEVRTVSGVSATTFTGKTKAVSEVNLAFRVAGQIERILVKEGDYVKKGQIVQSCPTLHNPMDCSLPGSSIHGIHQARVLE